MSTPDTRELARNIDHCLEDAQTMVQMAIDEILVSTQTRGASPFDLSLAAVCKMALAGVHAARDVVQYTVNHLDADEADKGSK